MLRYLACFVLLLACQDDRYPTDSGSDMVSQDVPQTTDTVTVEDAAASVGQDAGMD